MKILVDMDDVLADYEQGFIDRWVERHPDKPYVPIEKRASFTFKGDYPKELHPLVDEIRCVPEFNYLLKPITGGLEAITKMQDLGHAVFICTSPFLPYQNCVLDKYRWTEKHLGADWLERLIITRDKTMIRGDILIDDNPCVKGIEIPTWEQILYDQPFNRKITGKRRMTWANWETVLKELFKVLKN